MFGASGDEYSPGQLYVRYADNIRSLFFYIRSLLCLFSFSARSPLTRAVCEVS